MMKEGDMKVVDCNNHVKNAIEFFGKSCAVNSLINKYNPIGDNSDKLCHLCVGKVPGGWCTPTDPYFGFDGAFRCLMEAGEIAFLKHTTVQEMIASKSFKGVTPDQFQLLCKNGQRMPISEYLNCNWGMVPANAIVTSSARSLDQRKQYQKFMRMAVKLYAKKASTASYNSTSSNDRSNRFNNDRFGSNERFNDRNNRNDNRNAFGYSSTTESSLNDSQPFESFELFESGRYGAKLNLLFQVSRRICKSSRRFTRVFNRIPPSV
jgi:hypothetical protein